MVIIVYTQADGEFLVRTARKAIKMYIKDNKILAISKIPPNLRNKTGVFVTIRKQDTHGDVLRGCIGHLTSDVSLLEVTIDSAIHSATRDPRFPPVTSCELKTSIIEVTILTPLELINVNKPSDYLNEIEIGRLGLLIEKDSHKGVLLPQVPIEWNWDSEEFLIQLCRKAGLSTDSWCMNDTKIYRFSSKIYKELSPNGDIVQESLKLLKE